MMKFVCALLFAFFVQTVFAVQVNHLYSTSVPVSSQSTAQRKRGLHQALAKVLIRASGDDAVVQRAPMKQALQQASQYVREYSYEKQQNDDGSQTLQMSVTFDAIAINQLLQQAKVPVWSSQRPLTLLWLVIKDSNGTHLINASSAHPIIQVLQKEMDARGIPMSMPLLDLSDLQQVSPDDVWYLNQTAISNASKRYRSNAVLIGRIDETDSSHLNSQWTLKMEDSEEQWSVPDSTEENIGSMSVKHLAQALLSRFMTPPNNTVDDITLSVTGLHNVTDYAQLTRYLENLSGVTHVSVLDISSNAVQFKLSINVSVDALKRNMELSPVLNGLSIDNTDPQNLVLNAVMKNQ
ncbi:MAG: DUF2066 domain-containing protein [Gammaproteobacteria bacterium]|nr:DUF2066 domain-containing protein [Gammaproteobacteria bacterium]